MSDQPIRRALLSVSDKTGLLDLARTLVEFGVEMISTGGTRRALADASLPVRDIAEVTGFPEILDGRVKTLHPRIHAGILAVRELPEHMSTLQKHGIATIDLVVCNLYPFEATVARPASSHEEIVENIDIGGPSLIRASAKNYRDVAIVTDPGQYPLIIEQLRAGGGSLTLEIRERLAAAAYARTAAYDRAISAYFAKRVGQGEADLPAVLDLRFKRKQALRYGENPHQPAAFYVEPGLRHACVATAETLHGKELSFNNLLDLDSALNLVREFTEPAAVVIKHNNPCGAAVGASLEEAFRKAYEGDPLSAYGGVLAFNRAIDEATAYQITEPNRFVECIIGPAFSDAAFALLTTRPTWKKSVRLLRTGDLTAGPPAHDYRRVDGGLLVQARDQSGDDFRQARPVTKRPPTSLELQDLQFAWQVCKHVKSNAIVLARGGMVVGVGAGQMSRVDAVHLAVRKAGDRARGSVLASDAFFPFRDNIDEAARAGIAAIVQPGGSMRDADCIQACDQQGLAMVMTGVRHFRH